MDSDTDFRSWFDCSGDSAAGAGSAGEAGAAGDAPDRCDDRRWWRERVRDARRHAFLAEQRRRGAEGREQSTRLRVGQLERELATLPRIEQAKGMLMAVFGLDPEAALRVLDWVAQRARAELAVVADRFVELTRTTVSGPHVGEQVVAVLVELARHPDGISPLESVPRPRDNPSGRHPVVLDTGFAAGGTRRPSAV